MRVSERGKYEVTNTRVGKAKEDNLQTLEEMSTQKKINRVSDDPIGMGQAIKLHDKIGRSQQCLKNISYSKGFLERTESVVGGIGEFLVRSKELSLGMANSTNNAESRKATAQEIKEIISELVAMGNSAYAGRYLFSGFRINTPPLTEDGTYVGDDGTIFLQVDEGQFKQINIRARELFDATQEEREAGHCGMIQTLTVLYDGLMSNEVEPIRKSVEDLDFLMEKTANYQAKIGAVASALASAEKRLEIHGELNAVTLSGYEDADVFKTTSDFKKTDAVLQSTLLASNKLLEPSLLNFLK